MQAPPAQPSILPVTDSATDSQHWRACFAERPDLLQGPSRLVEFRQQALDRLDKTPFPTRRDEDWRYSDFTKYLRQDFLVRDALVPDIQRADFEIPDFDGFVLVTVDGAFRPALSDDVPGLHISTVEASLEQEPYAFWLDRTLAELHAPAENAFVALNAAFAKTSLFIAAERNQRLGKPIHIIHLATRHAGPQMLCSQVFVMMPQGAELTIDETFHTLGEGKLVFRNHLVRAGLSAQARLEYRSIQDEDRRDIHLSNFAADQQAGSKLDHARVDLGGVAVRNNLSVSHKAAGLETSLNGLFFARDRQRIDNQTFIDHAFPHGESNELYKGIVMDRGVTSFNGKVMVRPDAQKTNAFQQNDNLVIGQHAEANAKPQLEIFADDVKCSHGATIGQLDEGPLYYLMSRGITRGEGLAMLQRGFLLEVLDTIDSSSIRNYVERKVLDKFNA